MGDLKHFDLKPFIEKYKLEYMIETGTCYGDGVAYGLQFGFKYIFSVELIDTFYKHSIARFANNDNVQIVNGTSEVGLQKILTENKIGNCLFWLDAHLPNFYEKENYSNDYKKDKQILIPLENELLTICKNKDVSNDVFIVDDLRIYETNNYQKGNWDGAIAAGVGGTVFIYKLLEKTHDIFKYMDDEGYLVCTPKERL